MLHGIPDDSLEICRIDIVSTFFEYLSGPSYGLTDVLSLCAVERCRLLLRRKLFGERVCLYKDVSLLGPLLKVWGVLLCLFRLPVDAPLCCVGFDLVCVACTSSGKLSLESAIQQHRKVFDVALSDYINVIVCHNL